MPKSWFPAITKSSPTIQTIFAATIFLSGSICYETDKVLAQTILSCNLTSKSQEVSNTAIAAYLQSAESANQGNIISNRLKTNLVVDSNQIIQVTNQGVLDDAGNLVSPLSIIVSGLIDLYKQQGLNAEEANAASVATITGWVAVPADSSSVEVVTAIKQKLGGALGDEKKENIEQIPDSELLTTLAGLNKSSLEALGLSAAEIETASQTEITPQTEGSFINQIQDATQRVAESITRPEAKAQITEVQAQSELELENIRQGNQTTLTPGSQLRYKFLLANQSDREIDIELPNIQTLTENGLTGSGTVTAIIYRLATAKPEDSQTITDLSQVASIPGGQSLELEIQVELGEIAQKEISAIGIDLQTDCGDERNPVQPLNILPSIILDDDDDELIDPRGQISGCAGEILADYLGFSVAMYDIDANDPTESEVSQLTELTTTELPDNPNNNIPPGIEPNIENSNPFFLTNNDEGKYSFLFDEEEGQLDFGRSYILLVDPGENSIYDQRRIKITIGDRLERVVEYTATSLDGRPITAVDNQTTITGEIVLVEDAERVGLNLAVLDLSTNVCDAQEIDITKTGDRAAAEPGDIVLYRLAIRNLASVPITNFQIIDTLPAGFRLESGSVRGETGSGLVPINSTQSSDRLVNFTANITLPSEGVLNLVYAAQVTPDAVRGSGENSAIVNANRTDNSFTVKDGPAVHSLRIDPGILEDAGILIGRVFVDKNFDGEQQSGEPGIPNAVIYLEDGNRIITDADGLFSVTNLLPGYHTGILDLTTIPEYRLAPNLRFSESNSTSRLVNLEPGGMVRMNFGVTPTASGKDQDSESRPKNPSSTPETPKDNKSER